MSLQFDEFAKALRKKALNEYKTLSQAWHAFRPEPGDMRTKSTVDVRDYGGVGSILLPDRHVTLHELDELIEYMESIDD